MLKFVRKQFLYISITLFLTIIFIIGHGKKYDFSTFWVSYSAGSESLVVHKIILKENNQDVSDGGFMLALKDLPTIPRNLNNIDYIVSNFYTGNFGLQGVFYETIYKAIPFLSYLPNKIIILKIMSCFLLAIAISLLLRFFHEEFGLISLFLAILSIIYSPELLMAAKDLYWRVFSFFIPLLTILYYFKNIKPQNIKFINLFFFAFLPFMVLFLCGLEFITVILVNAVLFLFYYAIKNRYSLTIFIKSFLIIVLSGITAIFLSTVMLVIKISNFLNISLKESVISIFKRISYNTNFFTETVHLTHSEKAARLINNNQGSYYNVLKRYFYEYDIIGWLSAFDIIVIFGLTSLVIYLLKYKDRQYWALVTINIFSFFSILAWYILAHSHAAHAYIFFVFYTPFTLLFSAWLAYSIKIFIKISVIRYQKTDLTPKVVCPQMLADSK